MRTAAVERSVVSEWALPFHTTGFSRLRPPCNDDCARPLTFYRTAPRLRLRFARWHSRCCGCILQYLVFRDAYIPASVVHDSAPSCPVPRRAQTSSTASASKPGGHFLVLHIWRFFQRLAIEYSPRKSRWPKLRAGNRRARERSGLIQMSTSALVSRQPREPALVPAQGAHCSNVTTLRPAETRHL